MKKLLLTICMVAFLTSPAWGQSNTDVIANDNSNANQITTAIGTKIDEQTTILEGSHTGILNAVNGITIPPVDLSPAIAATTAGEANVIANDNLNTQAILDAITVAVPASPCGAVLPGQRFVSIPETDEVCDVRSGVIWPRVWSRSLPGIVPTDFNTAQASCVAEGKRLPNLRDWNNLYTHNIIDNNSTISGHHQRLSWLEAEGGFEVGPFCAGVTSSNSCRLGQFWTDQEHELINVTSDFVFVFKYFDVPVNVLSQKTDTERNFTTCVR
jgi:hypothetical protein